MWLLGWAPPVAAHFVPARNRATTRPTPHDLRVAIISRDIREVERLLQGGVDASVAVGGSTPLSLALYHQDNQIVETLLQHRHSHSFDINHLSLDHVQRLEPPIITSCRFKNISAVQLLVENGADLESVDRDQRSALYMAVEQRDLAIVRYLIEQGACLNPSLHFSRSPIFAAIGKSDRRSNIACLLILSGADVEEVEMGPHQGTLLSHVASRSVHSLQDRRVLHLMIASGVGIAGDSCVRQQYATGNFLSNAELCRSIGYELANPVTLQRQCLRAIRRRVVHSCQSRFVLHCLNQLPLPKSLLDMVMLKEFREGH